MAETIIPGFTAATARVNGQEIFHATGGDGPPVLLLHGFPQTHALWARVAPRLAARYRVVSADLRGYGASSKPKGVENYSFREMGADMTALMAHLGHERFHLVGHDRGARVAHRMALDGAAPASLTLMDIVPTHLLLSDLRAEVAASYYHWFFLAQPEGFPEKMIGADPDHFFEACLLGWGGAKLADFHADQLAAYRAAWSAPETIRAMCDDYRAALSVDYGLDAADLGRRPDLPALVMWGADGAMARAYDVAATWADRLIRITARPMPGGHFFVDQYPDRTAAVLLDFLDRL